MAPAELTTLALTFHASVFGCAVVAYYKYGDRTEVFNKSLQGTDVLLVRIRRAITDNLSERLNRVLENPGMSPMLVIPDAYLERPLNPVGSESYLESLREFIENSSGALQDYHSVFIARREWCFWAKSLSWAICALLIWQALAVGFVAIGCKLCELNIAGWIVKASFWPTIVAACGCFVPLPLLLLHHDKIGEFRVRYDIH